MTKNLGEFEQLILFALLDLAESESYGVLIREAIERRTGRTVSLGAVYTGLERLQEQGLVSSHVGEPTAERGGRRKRLYRLQPKGAEALDRSVRTFNAMSRGLLPRLRARLAGNDSPNAREDA